MYLEVSFNKISKKYPFKSDFKDGSYVSHCNNGFYSKFEKLLFLLIFSFLRSILTFLHGFFNSY